MGSNILEERMLEDTLAVFRSGSLADVTAAQGIMLIDGWLQALQGDPNLEQLQGQLTALRTELQASQPDGQQIRPLLEGLAYQAQQVAEGPSAEGTWTGGLESLSKILRSVADSL